MTTVTMAMIEMIGWLTLDVTKEANLSSFTLCWCLHSWFSLLTWLQCAGTWICVETMLTGLPFLFALCSCTHLSQTGHDHTSWGTVEATFSCWGSWCEMWAEHEQMVCDRELCSRAVSLITTGIPNDGCSTLLFHCSPAVIIQNIMWDLAQLSSCSF